MNGHSRMFITVKCPVQRPRAPASSAVRRQRKAICKTKRIIGEEEKKTCKYWTTHSAFAESAERFVCGVFFLFNVQYYHVPWRWPSARGQSQSIVCHRHHQGNDDGARACCMILLTCNRSLIGNRSQCAGRLRPARFVWTQYRVSGVYTAHPGTEARKHKHALYQNTSWNFLSCRSGGTGRESFCLHNNRLLYIFRWDMNDIQLHIPQSVCWLKPRADTETRRKRLARLGPRFDRRLRKITGGLQSHLVPWEKIKSRDNRYSVIYPRPKKKSQNKIGRSTPRKCWIDRSDSIFGSLECY